MRWKLCVHDPEKEKEKIYLIYILQGMTLKTSHEYNIGCCKNDPFSVSSFPIRESFESCKSYNKTESSKGSKSVNDGDFWTFVVTTFLYNSVPLPILSLLSICNSQFHPGS